jgi:hypothetical protein
MMHQDIHLDEGLKNKPPTLRMATHPRLFKNAPFWRDLISNEKSTTYVCQNPLPEPFWFWQVFGHASRLSSPQQPFEEPLGAMVTKQSGCLLAPLVSIFTQI